MSEPETSDTPTTPGEVSADALGHMLRIKSMAPLPELAEIIREIIALRGGPKKFAKSIQDTYKNKDTTPATQTRIDELILKGLEKALSQENKADQLDHMTAREIQEKIRQDFPFMEEYWKFKDEFVLYMQHRAQFHAWLTSGLVIQSPVGEAQPVTAVEPTVTASEAVSGDDGPLAETQG